MATFHDDFKVVWMSFQFVETYKNVDIFDDILPKRHTINSLLPYLPYTGMMGVKGKPCLMRVTGIFALRKFALGIFALRAFRKFRG